MKYKKIYVVDLDHTLCDIKLIPEENNRWDYQNAKPYLERIEKINRLYEEGNQIIIDTARGSTSGNDWYKKTKNQLDSWGLKYHILRTGTKFPADYYIDDKAINSEEFFNDK